MNKVKLNIRDTGTGLGYGIFPLTNTEDQRRLELRARSVLAYGYSKGIIKPTVSSHLEGKIVLLDEQNRTAMSQDEVNDGLEHAYAGKIYVPESMSVAWENMPCRMYLHVGLDVDVEAALKSYFEASLRWLDDNNAVKFIERKFKVNG